TATAATPTTTATIVAMPVAPRPALRPLPRRAPAIRSAAIAQCHATQSPADRFTSRRIARAHQVMETRSRGGPAVGGKRVLVAPPPPPPLFVHLPVCVGLGDAGLLASTLIVFPCPPSISAQGARRPSRTRRSSSLVSGVRMVAQGHLGGQ